MHPGSGTRAPESRSAAPWVGSLSSSASLPTRPSTVGAGREGAAEAGGEERGARKGEEREARGLGGRRGKGEEGEEG